MCSEREEHARMAEMGLSMVPPCQAIRGGLSLLLTVNELAEMDVANGDADAGHEFTVELIYALCQALDPTNHALTDAELAQSADRAAELGFEGQPRTRKAMVEMAVRGVQRLIRSFALAIAVFDEDEKSVPEILTAAAVSYPDGFMESVRVQYDEFRRMKAEREGREHVRIFSEDGSLFLGEQLSLDMLSELDDLPVLDSEPVPPDTTEDMF